MLGDAGEFRDCEVKTLMTPSRCTALGRVELESVSLSGKALRWGTMRKLQFIVHAAVYCPCCRLAALCGALRTLLLQGNVC